jgi:hypothetical protein
MPRKAPQAVSLAPIRFLATACLELFSRLTNCRRRRRAASAGDAPQASDLERQF